MYKLHVIPALKDNYIWILENDNQQGVIIDPSESTPVINYLTQHNITPLGILLTHHHADHIGGVLKLQQYYPTILIYGPTEISLPIAHINGHDKIQIADFYFNIISVPGHTLGHVAYYCKTYLFCGDTLFSGGCGRILEGTYEQMLTSLNKLKNLPGDTLICAGHEYTLSNLKFAQKILPDNPDVLQYLKVIANKNITLPSILSREKKINLFLRCNDVELQNKLNINNELELFSFFRSQKDKF